MIGRPLRRRAALGLACLSLAAAAGVATAAPAPAATTVTGFEVDFSAANTQALLSHGVFPVAVPPATGGLAGSGATQHFALRFPVSGANGQTPLPVSGGVTFFGFLTGRVAVLDQARFDFDGTFGTLNFRDSTTGSRGAGVGSATFAYPSAAATDALVSTLNGLAGANVVVNTPPGSFGSLIQING